MYRKFIILSLFVITGCFSCSKEQKEQAKEDLVVNLITNNIWVVKNFTEDNNDLTLEFSDYEFKFNKDGTVYGIHLSAPQPNAVGTWLGNATAMTIESYFKNETSVLKKLNGVWKIYDNTLSEVKAKRIEGQTEFKLYLIKK